VSGIVDYQDAVESAPAGWRRFSMDDVQRLPRAVREHEMARVPPGEPAERIVRALFWTLVYHHEPALWDELASAEPIAPELVAALPAGVGTALDVGAGSGRLTRHLTGRSRRVVAVEPSAGLRELLAGRLPRVDVVAGWAERLPFSDGLAELTAACGAFGPDPVVLDELARVTAPGGTVVLISPEQPEWFEAHGWRRLAVPRPAATPHRAEIEELFGPLDPPHEMVSRSV
jgi:SAM-dependent methyltransferase